MDYKTVHGMVCRPLFGSFTNILLAEFEGCHIFYDHILPPWPLFLKRPCDSSSVSSLHCAISQSSILGVQFLLLYMLPLGHVNHSSPSSRLSFRHIFKCLVDTCSCMSHKHLKFNFAKLYLSPFSYNPNLNY